MKTLIFLLIGLFSFVGSAAELSFNERIQEAQKQCPMLNCPGLSVQVTDLSITEYRALGTETRIQLKQLATLLAEDVWGDSILEGPYENLGRYKIDWIQKVLIDSEQAGFRVTYSDKAWDTETCDYNPEDRSTLDSCQSGRIVESAFINLALDSIYRDEEAMAEFVPDQEPARQLNRF